VKFVESPYEAVARGTLSHEKFAARVIKLYIPSASSAF
jgi:hypothetical protein